MSDDPSVLSNLVCVCACDEHGAMASRPVSVLLLCLDLSPRLALYRSLVVVCIPHVCVTEDNTGRATTRKRSDEMMMMMTMRKKNNEKRIIIQ